MHFYYKYSILSLLILMFLIAPAAAQNKDAPPANASLLTFGLTMRFRYEFQNNFNQKFYGDNPGRGSSNDGFLLGRFRAGFNWRPTDKIHLSLWGQHSESWDCALPDSAFYNSTLRATHHPNRDHWELYNTFIEFTNMFDTGLSLKAGRQTIAYGDYRIFGPGEWGNTGVWIWDAVKLSQKFERGFIDVFYGRTMLHEVRQFSLNHRHGYDSLGLYSHFDLLRGPVNLFIEPTLFTKRDMHRNYTGENKKKGNLDSWYGGGRINAQTNGFEIECMFLQEQGSFARDDLDAYGYHTMLAYTFKAPWKPRLAIEYSYASGDSNPNDGEHETFQGAFGARDKMYGRMNLFHWRNLKDLEVNLQLKPAAWLHIKAELHKFQLAERRDAWYLNPKAYRDPTGQSGDDVGKEFDILCTCKLPRGHTVMGGFGHFWPDEFAKKLASSKQANWVFVQWEYAFSTKLL
jgi:hypothetical protein